MADLSLWFGGDLAIGSTGDVALADGSVLTEQRVLRRLLTNSGDYIWQLNYGAGLGQFVGQPGAPAMLTGLTRVQIMLESAVANTPTPTILANSLVDGTVNLTVRYADAVTGNMSSLSFSV